MLLFSYFALSQPAHGFGGATGGITRVQGITTVTSASSKMSVTMSNIPATGDVLVAAIGVRSPVYPLYTVSSITQTGVTWSRATMFSTTGSQYNPDVEIWYGAVGSGASETINITLSGTPTLAVADICEYSGLLTVNPVDKTATNYDTTTSPDTGTTAPTTQANELWVGAVSGIMVNENMSSSTNNFTLLDGAHVSLGGYGMELGYLEKIVSSTGTANSGVTLASAEGWCGCIATFISSSPSQAPATQGITRVQGITTVTSASSKMSVTMSNIPATGDVLVAAIGVRSPVYPLYTVSSITQTGVTWSRATMFSTTGNLFYPDVEIWYGAVGSGASETINITLSGTPTLAVADICEYSGLLTVNPVDKTATNYDTTTSPDTGTTAPTTQANELWVGAVSGIMVNENMSSSTNNFTLLDGTEFSSGGYGMQLGYLEKIVSSTGTANSGVTLASAEGWCGCIATFISSSPSTSVTLNSPLNCAAYAHNPVTFSFTPTYATSAQLWMNVSGTWQSVASNQTNIINNAQNSISYVMPQDNNRYLWNIEVINSAGNAFAPKNFTITDSPLGSGMALTVDGTKLLNSAGNTVYLRGVGAAGMVPDLIFWGQNGSDSWGDQWQSASSASVIQTLQVLSQTWHVNMIRFFIYPEWFWRGNVTPSVESGTGFSSKPINVTVYLQTLASECKSYGIYLDIVPYQLTAGSSSFSSDPYLASNSSGIPLMNDWGDTADTAFIRSTGLTEKQFWSQYWTLMANTFKQYPNVIFEAWNEPETSSFTNLVPSGYLTYLTTMYNAIRATGSSNLVFMMWWDGWEPNGWGQNMAWAGQIANTLGAHPNLVFNNHLYYYSPSPLTSYWDQNSVSNSNGGVPLTAAQLQTTLNALINGGTDAQGYTYPNMGVSAPVVMNEEGDGSLSSSNVTNDYIWWNNLLQAQNALGIGAGAYYWLSSRGLGPTYDGNELLTSGYAPNTMGQEYITAYISPS